MEASRVFVRGLPPNLGPEEFRKHFSKPSPVTDTRLISHRRIGYVGYKTHSDAVKAVKYFNKSYIGMSRIFMELARPIEERQANKPTDSHGIVPHTRADLGKLEFMNRPNPTPNPKLQEFLEVMQPPSKSKVWANEDGARGKENDVLVQDTIAAEIRNDQSDDQYEPVAKKRKLSSKAGSETPSPLLIEIGSVDTKTIDEIVIKSTSPENATGAESMELPMKDGGATSDIDWLRSRTSRLLGLVDGDYDVVQPEPTVPESKIDNNTIYRVHQETRKEIAVGSSQTDPEPPKQGLETEFLPAMNSAETASTARLFIRNLTYTASEDELRKHFGQYGPLSEVHVPIDARICTGKGFAYVQYEDAEKAQQALKELDGTSFQGRLLHILPAVVRKRHILNDYEFSKLPIKIQRQIRRKSEAASSTFKWNTLYMNTDAVMSSISHKLGISKSELLDPTSSDAAVKQAHAETNIIQETKAYFAVCGIDLESFSKHEWSDTAILVKNFPYGTSLEELKKAFEAYGTVKKLLMPPTGTIAIVDYDQATQARAAFGALSYRKFKDSVLFLERAPKGLFNKGVVVPSDTIDACSSSNNVSAADILEDTELQIVENATLFVRNLNFSTNSERLREVFHPLNGFVSARVKTKVDPKKPGQVLSMGFGFLEFGSKEQAQAALVAMNGYRLDGHDLVLKISHKALDAAEERRKDDQAKKVAGRRTKIIIKNLPFEASKKDVRSLFGAYGKLRSVRVPRKFDSSTRGFAFADFVTAREAENAMGALKNTHLLGRRLVLDFATEDSIDPEEEIEKLQKKVGRQADTVAVQKLTSVGRKRFTIRGAGEAEDD